MKDNDYISSSTAWYRYESRRQEQRRLFYARVAAYCFGLILMIAVWAIVWELALQGVHR